MTDLYVRHHADHTIDHAQTCAQDGDDCQLLACDAMAFRNSYGSLYVDLFKRKITGGLVAHQHCYLGNDLAELLYAGVLITQDGQLVLNKGMVEYAYFAHVLVLLYV